MQKGISTLIGVIIILAVAIIAFGVVFGYQYFAVKNGQISNENTEKITNNQNLKTQNQAREAILHNFNNGVGIEADNFIWGDVDGDGVDEAVLPSKICPGANCFYTVTIYKFFNSKVLSVVLQDNFGFELPDSYSSADKAKMNKKIDSIKIDNGLLIITETGFNGTTTNSYRVELIDGRLQANKI